MTDMVTLLVVLFKTTTSAAYTTKESPIGVFIAASHAYPDRVCSFIWPRDTSRVYIRR